MAIHAPPPSTSREAGQHALAQAHQEREDLRAVISARRAKDESCLLRARVCRSILPRAVSPALLPSVFSRSVGSVLAPFSCTNLSLGSVPVSVLFQDAGEISTRLTTFQTTWHGNCCQVCLHGLWIQ